MMPGWSGFRQTLRTCVDGYWRNIQIAFPWIILHPAALMKALFYAAALVAVCLTALAYALLWAAVTVLWTTVRLFIWLTAWLSLHVIWLFKSVAAGRQGTEKPEPPALPFGSFLRRVSREMTGLEYEQYVARRLRKEKYRKVEVTRGSGDFGADILALDPWGNSISIQCKYYGGKVGVHAVQEIVAAQQYYATERAMVITNSVFTPAAVTLAGQTGVDLVENYI